MIDKNWLLQQLQHHISENKIELFNHVIQSRTRHITVALENIYQPHNASAVLRSCDCFGIQDVHIIENNNKYETSSGVDMGSSKWLTLHRYNKSESNTLHAIQQLKNTGYKIAATTPHKNQYMIDELPIEEPIALLFGTEMTGLSQEAMDASDYFVKLPMFGFTESYNISVSVALSLYETTNRLRKSVIDWKLTDEEILDLKLHWTRQVIRKSEKVEKEIIDRFLNS